MKNRLAVVLVILTLQVEAQDEPQFLQTIVYTVEPREDRLEVFEDYGWFHCLSPTEYQNFYIRLFNMAMNDEIPIYEPYDHSVPPNAFELIEIPDSEQWYTCFATADTVMLTDAWGEPVYDGNFHPIIEIMDHVYDPAIDYVGLQFIEDWYIHPATGEITKVVRGIDFVLEQLSRSREFRIQSPMFHIALNTTMDAVKTGELVKQNYFVPTPIINPETNSELNWWESHIEASARYQLTETILANVRSGTQMVYELPDRGLPTNQLVNPTDRLYWLDTAYKTDAFGDPIYNPVNFEPLIEVTANEFDYRSILGYSFLENWYFDFKNLSMSKVLKGAIPHQTAPESDYMFSESEPLFFVPYDNYVANNEVATNFFVDYVESTCNFDRDLFFYPTDDYWARVHLLSYVELEEQMMESYVGSVFDRLTPGMDDVLAYDRKMANDHWPLTEEYIEELTYFIDTAWSEMAFDDWAYETDTVWLGAHMARGLGFVESWQIDMEQYTFTKEVSNVILSYRIYDDNGDIRDYTGKLIVNTPDISANKIKKDDNLVGKDVQNSVNIRDPQLMYMTRLYEEETNSYSQTPYFPLSKQHVESTIRVPIVEKILEDVRDGNITAYAAWDSLVPLEDWQLIDVLCQITAITPLDAFGDYVYDPLTGEIMVRYDTLWLAVEHVDRFVFHEDWYLDTRSGAWYKDVKGVTIDYVKEPSDWPTMVLADAQTCSGCEGLGVVNGTDCSRCSGRGCHPCESITQFEYVSFYIKFN